jgi:hypothetical protein
MLRGTYAALSSGGEPPVGLDEVEKVAELVEALKPREVAS